MKQNTVIDSEQAKGERDSGKWMGAFMIFTGLIFFAATSGFTIGGYSPTMLIALVPIFWIGVAAHRRYQEDGYLSRRVISIAVFAVLPFAFMAAMALGYSISGLWPLGIIVVGVSFMLLGSGK